MVDAVLVRDLNELKIIRKLFGCKLEKLQIHTLCPLEYLRLIRVGIQPHIFSQYLSREESCEIYHLAFQSISSVVDSFLKREEPLAINLARYFKVHYCKYLADVYAFDKALSRIAENLKGGRFFYLYRFNVTLTDPISLWNPNFISTQILNSLNEKKSTTVQFVPCGILRSASDSINTIRTKLGMIKLEVNNLLSCLCNSTHKSLIDNKARIIAFGSSYDALIVISEALRLSAEGCGEPLWMTEWVDRDTVRSGLRYRDAYNQIERFSISNFLRYNSIPSLTKKERNQVDELFQELKVFLNRIDVIRRYDLTDGLYKLRDCFRYALWRTRVLDRVLSQFAGSTIIVTNYNGIDERIIEQLAPRHQIKIIARHHGWLDWIEDYDYHANMYLVSGKLEAEVATSYYGKDISLCLSPDSNLVNTANEWINIDSYKQQTIIRKRRDALFIQTPYVVLLMSTAARPHILNEFDYLSFYQLWTSIFQYLCEHPDIYIIVKSHKLNFNEWIKYTAWQYKINNFSILEGRLEDVIIIADLVIDLGRPGTATMVSLLFNKPTILYRGLYKYVLELSNLVHMHGITFSVDNPEALMEELEKFRNNSVNYLSNLRKKNESLLNLLVEFT